MKKMFTKLGLVLLVSLFTVKSLWAQVTVLNGSEETALRKAVRFTTQAQVKAMGRSVFFNRDGFWDKLQADLAAGTTEFDINLTIPTQSVAMPPTCNH